MTFAAAATEVEGLKAKLKKAKEAATEEKAVAAERVAAKLKPLKTMSGKHEVRVAEVQQELKDAVTKCEDLEQKNKYRASELSKVKQEFQDARTETRGGGQEVKQIVDGKPYLLQSAFGGRQFALPT